MMKIQDRLREQEKKTFVGREKEIRRLLECLDEDGPLVTFVHGVGGIGKSSLLKAFAEEAQKQGAKVIRLDCRDMKPTRDGFLEGLGRTVGETLESEEDAADYFGKRKERIVLALDTYERFRIMDLWMRNTFIPGMPDHMRILLFGREAPVSSWLTSPGWQGLFRDLELGPLSPTSAVDLLTQLNVGKSDIRRILQFAGGHPLALKLAAKAVPGHPNLNIENTEIISVVKELARIYLKDVQKPLTRHILEAACVVRRVTRSLLKALLPELDDREAYESLAALPFVESTKEGLVIHDIVRQAFEILLASSAPDQYRAFRTAAWKFVKKEMETAGNKDLWSYTADLIFLADHPGIRDPFFSTESKLYFTERARPGDEETIFSVTNRYDGPESARMISYWWEHAPQSFYVIRDSADRIVSYYVVFNPYEVDERVLKKDPLVWQWFQHLKANPVPQGQDVLFFRRSLALKTGEIPLEWAGMGICWLDIVWSFLNNSRLRRIYIAFKNRQVTNLTPIDYASLPDIQESWDGQVFYSFYKDFGQQLVFGYLKNLVESGFRRTETECRLDEAAHQLVLDGKGIPLTPLEFGVMRHLNLNTGRAVPRAELMKEVWGYSDQTGSNVVDSIVRSLRKKLGRRAAAIETVSGLGYKFRGFDSMEKKLMST